MPEDPNDEITIDFEAEMKSLSEEATRQSSKAESAKSTPAKDTQALASLIRPIAVRLEELARGSAEHARLLEKITGFERAFDSQAKEIKEMRQTIEKLEDAESRAVGHEMFTALHEELRKHQDDQIFDSFQRPLLMELITIYDAIEQLTRQISQVAEAASSLTEASSLDEAGLHHLPTNLENLGAEILEVFSRYEVERVDVDSPKLDKRLQRAVRVNPTDDPDQDQNVVEQLRPAFVRGTRVLRPANVVILRHEPPETTPKVE